MKEAPHQLSKREVIVEVQRLTKERMVTMGLVNNVPAGEIRVVALRKDMDGDILQSIVMEDVDEKRFLHGEEEYFDLVLKQAEKLFGFKK